MSLLNMNIYKFGWSFRRSAPIAPPLPDHSLKTRVEDMYKDASAQRRFAMQGDTPAREAQAASAKSHSLIREISETVGKTGDKYRAEKLRFAEREATFNAGVNILFIDPDNALQSPRANATAGVNIPGIRASFAWDEACVQNLLRVLEHTNARLVLTSGWRNRPTMRARFNRELVQRGLHTIIGRTNVVHSNAHGSIRGGGRPAEARKQP